MKKGETMYVDVASHTYLILPFILISRPSMKVLDLRALAKLELSQQVKETVKMEQHQSQSVMLNNPFAEYLLIF